MSTHAKVGAFVLVCAAIFLATVYRVSNIRVKGARVPYRTYLRYAGGLEPGADVLFDGRAAGPAGSNPHRDSDGRQAGHAAE